MDALVAIVAVLALVGWGVVAARGLFARTAGGDALRRSVVRPRSLVVGVPVIAVLLLVGAPFAYIQWGEDDAPPPLSFDDVPDNLDSSAQRSTSTSTTLTASGLFVTTIDPSSTTFPDSADLPDISGEPGAPDEVTLAPRISEVTGRWRVGPGSQAGYRTEEVLVGQNKETAGRTSDVTGEMTINDLTVEAGEFTVNMQTIKSDNEQRDGQFHGRIMDTQTYPTSHFVLTRPIVLTQLPADGTTTTHRATGKFTIRGKTREVSFDVTARRNSGRIEVLGSVPVRWDQYDIPEPSNAIAQVEDHGEIEFLLLLYRQAS